MRFVSRPVEIEAVQWGATGLDEVADFIGGVISVLPDNKLSFWCEKSSADVTIDWGDWVVAERDGIGFYPCVDAQFRERYEPIDLPVEDW